MGKSEYKDFHNKFPVHSSFKIPTGHLRPNTEESPTPNEILYSCILSSLWLRLLLWSDQQKKANDTMKSKSISFAEFSTLTKQIYQFKDRRGKGDKGLQLSLNVNYWHSCDAYANRKLNSTGLWSFKSSVQWL